MSDLLALLADIEALDCDQRIKRRFIDLLGKYSGQRLYISRSILVAHERRSLLQHLAHQRYSRSDLVRILSERWGVARRTAQRWVSTDD
jgi:hypothetical protein